MAAVPTPIDHLESVEVGTASFAPDFRERFIGALARQTAVIVRNALSLEERTEIQALAERKDTTQNCLDIDLHPDEVVSVAPVLGQISVALVSPQVVPDVTTTYTLRHRLHSTLKDHDGKAHHDNRRSTLESLVSLETRPGIRIVYQLNDVPSTVGIKRGSREISTPLAVGSGWAIPEDRFIGLPVAVRGGKLCFVRHPEHFGRSPAGKDRVLLVQDISFPLGVVLDTPFVDLSDVTPNNTSGLTDEEIDFITRTKRGKSIVSAINDLYTKSIN